jgi:hypothetical protein
VQDARRYIEEKELEDGKDGDGTRVEERVC